MNFAELITALIANPDTFRKSDIENHVLCLLLCEH